MNAIPAYVAGVNQIIMVSPANSQGEINQTVLAAAHITGCLLYTSPSPRD